MTCRRTHHHWCTSRLRAFWTCHAVPRRVRALFDGDKSIVGGASMTYLREANARPASRTPVAAPGHGAAALQSWQAAVIALLQAGRTPVAACADAHVSVRQFRE